MHISSTLQVTRFSPRYYSLNHERQVKDDLRFHKLTDALERSATDGLSSVSFKMLRSRSERLYSNFTVVIDSSDADRFAAEDHAVSQIGREKMERRKERRARLRSGGDIVKVLGGE